MNNTVRQPRQGLAPVIALLLLAPIVSELLFGTTRITTIFVLLPQIGTWGCAALLIRDLARRRRLSGMAILLLGMALAVAEECIIQQTSLAPLVGTSADHVYGRTIGVNWVYFLWALVYESVWAVVIPIQLAELIFPDRRHEPWLGKRGRIVSTFVFVLASFVAWYSWTQVFVPRFFPESAYKPPVAAVLIALAVIVGLVITAQSSPGSRWAVTDAESTPGAPKSRLAGLAAFVLGLPWFVLIFLAYGAIPSLPAVIPIAVGLTWTGVALWLFQRWSTRADWADRHRLASIFGALGGSMLAGFFVLWASAAPVVDFMGKVVFNGIAIGLLIGLAGRIQNRPQSQSFSSSTVVEQSL
jgi:hypothetical protein